MFDSLKIVQKLANKDVKLMMRKIELKSLDYFDG